LPRELVAALIEFVEFEDEDDQELEQFLVAFSSRLAEALHTTQDDLRAVCLLTGDRRRERLASLVSAARKYDQAVHARAMEGLSVAAAAQLAGLAKWHDDRIELDPRIVLGKGLHADRTRKYVRFDVEGAEPVGIRRAKLQDASKALRFGDVTCWLDSRGLRFGWHRGSGGLILRPQPIERRDREAVLCVVIARPVARPVEGAMVRPEFVTSAWLREASAHLSPF
jgi:hypothetical protein